MAEAPRAPESKFDGYELRPATTKPRLPLWWIVLDGFAWRLERFLLEHPRRHG
jgi:hypothetical protein